MRAMNRVQSRAQRRPEPEPSLEGTASPRDEVIAGKALAPRAPEPATCIARSRDLQLRVPRTSRQLLDRVAATVARREVRLRVIRVCAQHGVDEAHGFEQIRPVDRRDRAHAHDHVADGYARCALPLVLVADDLVRRGAQRRQASFEPRQCRRRLRILVAQPLQQLHGEGRRQLDALELGQHLRQRLRFASAGAEQPVRQRSACCRTARRLAIHSAARRRFSISTTRSVIAIAHSSPIVSGCTR